MSAGPNPKKQKLSKKQREAAKLEEQKEKLIKNVRKWSNNNSVVNRAKKALEHLKTWQPKQFPYPCPVPGCQHHLPTQEILHWHIKGVGNAKHKAYKANIESPARPEEGEIYGMPVEAAKACHDAVEPPELRQGQKHELDDNYTCRTNQADIVSAIAVVEKSQQVGRKRKGASTSALPDPKKQKLLKKPTRTLLVLDTCVLVEDQGVEARQVIKLAECSAKDDAQKQQHDGLTTQEQVEVLIPNKVLSELDYQSKSQDQQDRAFAARVVTRMLREKLEAAAVQDKSQRVIRSQSLKESLEAAAKFLPKNPNRSTNDDHILACALLENERASQNLIATHKIEVVLVTLDNNLACKALANGLKVDSLSKFRDEYERRIRHRQNMSQSAAPAISQNNIIDLLSDSDDDNEVEISPSSSTLTADSLAGKTDQSFVTSPSSGENKTAETTAWATDHTMAPPESSDDLVAGLPNAVGTTSANAETAPGSHGHQDEIPLQETDQIPDVLVAEAEEASVEATNGKTGSDGVLVAEKPSISCIEEAAAVSHLHVAEEEAEQEHIEIPLENDVQVAETPSDIANATISQEESPLALLRSDESRVAEKPNGNVKSTAPGMFRLMFPGEDADQEEISMEEMRMQKPEHIASMVQALP